MKKIFVVANLFHASPRIPGLATYLPEFGWEAHVLTPPFHSPHALKGGIPARFAEVARVLEAPYSGDVLSFWRRAAEKIGLERPTSMTEQVKERLGIKEERSIVERLLYLYQAVFGYPDTERTWIRPALSVAREALRKEPFDVILSSSPYPASHLVAAELKREFRIPWVADFRDPWSQNHDYPYPRWRKRLDERLEWKTIGAADAILAASPAYAAKQAAFHERPVEAITNGFDPEMVNAPPAPLTKELTVTYTGMIYPRKQDPTKFLLGAKAFIAGNGIRPDEFRIRFYGPRQDWLQKAIEATGLQGVARQYGSVSGGEAVSRQRESQVLLLLGWEDANETGVYPAKTFEYLAARRPILVVGGTPREDIKKVVEETRTGHAALTEEEVARVLGALHQEYKRTGAVAYRGDADRVNAYSYRTLAKELSLVLERTCRSPLQK